MKLELPSNISLFYGMFIFKVGFLSKRRGSLSINNMCGPFEIIKGTMRHLEEKRLIYGLSV